MRSSITYEDTGAGPRPLNWIRFSHTVCDSSHTVFYWRFQGCRGLIKDANAATRVNGKSRIALFGFFQLQHLNNIPDFLKFRIAGYYRATQILRGSNDKGISIRNGVSCPNVCCCEVTALTSGL